MLYLYKRYQTLLLFYLGIVFYSTRFYRILNSFQRIIREQNMIEGLKIIHIL